MDNIIPVSFRIEDSRVAAWTWAAGFYWYLIVGWCHLGDLSYRFDYPVPIGFDLHAHNLLHSIPIELQIIAK